MAWDRVVEIQFAGTIRLHVSANRQDDAIRLAKERLLGEYGIGEANIRTVSVTPPGDWPPADFYEDEESDGPH